MVKMLSIALIDVVNFIFEISYIAALKLAKDNEIEINNIKLVSKF